MPRLDGENVHLDAIEWFKHKNAPDNGRGGSVRRERGEREHAPVARRRDTKWKYVRSGECGVQRNPYIKPERTFGDACYSLAVVSFTVEWLYRFSHVGFC